jgi:hypothetical protein
MTPSVQSPTRRRLERTINPSTSCGRSSVLARMPRDVQAGRRGQSQEREKSSW